MCMSDFFKGQQVIHCRDGLAVIMDDTLISGTEYFVVKAIRGAGEKIYVPIERASMIIRPLMTSTEADALIEYIKTIEFEYNPNTKQRRDALKKRLMSGDVKDVSYLFKQLYFYKISNGECAKLGPVDLEMLEYASSNLLDEFSITYNKPREEIEAFVYARLA